MSADWKTVFSEYVRSRNEMEMEETADTGLCRVVDEAYLRRRDLLLERVRAKNRERGIRPLKNELRLKMGDVKEDGERVFLTFRLKRRFLYDQDGRTFTEERMEQERLSMAVQNGEWTITRIEPLVEEKRHRPPDVVFSADVPFAPKKPVGSDYPGPYLHPSVQGVVRPVSGGRRYDRRAVKQYADTWWDYPNPEYIHFKVDCTNYVSQCLFAGGVPMDYTNSRAKGWWYRRNSGDDSWSYSWSVSHSLHWYLSRSDSVFRAERVDDPGLLDIGDVIVYDWDGNGHFQHSTIVAARDARGMPLVNAHTSNSKHRYWDYQDSYAWSEQTRYGFFHISDRV